MKKQNKINVEEYDPNWAIEFNKLKQGFKKHLDGHFISIEHVGSTSIVGLSAKPIIDLDIIIKDEKDKLEQVIKILEKLGYNHVGDLGIIGREAFKRKSSKVPFVESKSDWLEHHLYVCKKDSVSLLNHLKFRDYLRNNTKAKKEYSEIKKNLAEKFPYDIDSYIDGKTSFILEILKKLNFNKKDLLNIENQNKLKK